MNETRRNEALELKRSLENHLFFGTPLPRKATPGIAWGPLQLGKKINLMTGWVTGP